MKFIDHLSEIDIEQLSDEEAEARVKELEVLLAKAKKTIETLRVKVAKIHVSKIKH